MERRDDSRVEVSCPVHYSGEICPRTKVASTIDLSPSGSRIESSQDLDRDEMLEIIIGLSPQVIRCRARVIHVTGPDNGKMQAGIQFEGLSESDKHTLRQYLTEKSS